MFKRKSFQAILFIFLVFILINIFQINVHADTTPQGINMSNDRFSMPVTNKAGELYSPAVSSKVLAPNTDGTSVVQIVDAKGQADGIWGNPDRDNYIDISKTQTISMWLKMSQVNGGTLGDGLAFVLQNDSRKTNAISSIGTKINTGETLGVWGADLFPTESAPNGISQSAIQNSWALEFDPYPNKVVPSGDLLTNNPSASFDIGTADSHIASGFPGSTSTYTAHQSSFSKKQYYYTMNHTLPTNEYNSELFTPDIFKSNSWVHLTVTVDFPNKKISYAYNDKNLNGTPNNGNNKIYGSQTLSDADVNSQGRFGIIKNNQLLFGFTGSTGEVAENGSVIFEQIPGFVESSATPNFVDLSRNNKTLASKADYAYSGDKLALNYILKYVDGNEAWTNIKNKIILPQNITYTPDSNNNIGQVTIGATTEKIPMSAITTENGISTLNYTMLNSLSSSNDAATVTIYGTANKVTADTTVNSTHARFIGDNSITDTDSPVFLIKQPTLTLTSTSDNPLKLKKNQDANIVGNVSYTDTSKKVTNSAMTVHTILNNGAEKTFNMSSTDPVGQLNITVSKDDLNPDNTLQVYVTDSNGNVSNSMIFTITVAGGTVSLTQYPKHAYFKSVNYSTSKDQILGRSGDWGLTVSDTRGLGNTWRLTAEASKLVREGSTDAFDGEIIFKSGDNVESLNDDVSILEGTTVNDNSVTQIDSQWTDSSGILLRSDGPNLAGTYDGTIAWTLYDSI